ncbi:DNA-3-methyladenine glycosylase [Selenomonas sp. TAMA-11512]|uniref:DNA-3-methyladenine glycosylase family protein n=1 Tax=Selenomonas sp. TAMA-11512 TaxID=3095337 RepID=UPI00308827CB|nr:DNA-3-methyladenine glycosylase [Selenomonas sp. TAMA-11512]
MHVPCGEKELAYLKAKDKKLGAVIESLGVLKRPVHDDVFSAVVHHIIGQQISGKAQEAVWSRLCERVGTVNAAHLLALGREELQAVGMSFRKADYILDFAEKVTSESFDITALNGLSDAEIIAALSSLKGIGAWTAEMLMIFTLKRPDVLSFGDFGIQRGLRMLYRHREIDRRRFDRYKKRYSPYASTASLYLWAIAGGAIEGLTDPAATRKK